MLSPRLFNVFTDRIRREVKDIGYSSLPPCTVQILLFADDIVVCAEKKEDMGRPSRDEGGTGEMHGK